MRSSVTVTKWRSFHPWRADEEDFGFWILDFGLLLTEQAKKV
jgi:hypothetical protein